MALKIFIKVFIFMQFKNSLNFAIHKVYLFIYFASDTKM